MQINELMQNIQMGANRGVDAPNFSGEGIQKTTDGMSIDTGKLREIKMDSPFYSKNSLKDEMEKASVSGAESQAEIVKNQMVLASQTMSGTDLKKIEEDGLSVKDMDPETYTTIADKIKLQLAKAGADISIMGGLKQGQIEAISGNANYAAVMENALKEADLPATEELVQDGVIGMQKIDELPTGELSQESKDYLVKNNLSATVENIYRATYAGNDTSVNDGDLTTRDTMDKGMENQLKKVLTDAGLEITEDFLNQAKDMLSKGMPVTTDTVTYMAKLENALIPDRGTDVLQAMVDAVQEGKTPQEAILIPGESLMDQARDVVSTIENMEVDASDVKNHRALEELRLTMTVQASFRMIKSGIQIDTKDLTQLVSDLRAQEESFAKVMLGVGTTEDADGQTVTDYEIDSFIQVNATVTNIQNMPAVLLGRIPDIKNATLEQVETVGYDVQAQFKAMNQVYEAVGTEVRRDLGDSIQKAFQNVDSLLEDLGLDTSDENQRAVRILAYNQSDITVSNIQSMRSGDSLVRSTLKSLTPAVVAQMIKNDENPLEISITKLNERANEIQSDLETSTQKDAITRNVAEERYSKFLWKLDQSSELTDSERTSFIGIFRLIHQVNASDGAAIGMLLNQGQDVTLKNLLTAVRSRKAENSEFTIDEKFGYQESVTRESLTITEQIEMAYTAEKQASYTVERELSPYKLKQFESTDTVMEMAPSQLASALTAMEEPEEIEKTYYEEKAAEIRQSVKAEQQIFEILDEFDIPETPANLEAMKELLRDRNSGFKTLQEATKKRKVDSRLEVSASDYTGLLFELDDIIENSLEEFGEACKTPAEMAEAQENLYDRAENVLRNALLEDGVASLDLKALQRMNSQMGLFAGMAKSETYNIPIMVADQAGNMTLKIVRGEKKTGLVDIVLDMNSIGRLKASFETDGENVDGTISTDSNETRAAISEQAGALASAMQQATGLGVSLQFSWTREIDTNSIYSDISKRKYESETEDEDKKVQTRTLYGIAKSFIEMFEEVLS